MADDNSGSEMLKRLLGRLAEANKRRDGLVEARKAIVDVAKQEKRDGDSLTESEDKEFRAFTDQIREADKEIGDLDERITELSEEEKRSQVAVAASRRAAQVNSQLRVSEARTYERGTKVSYLKDLANAQIMGDAEARARLNRHAEEVMVEPEYKEYRDLNRADGSGGFQKVAAAAA